MTHTTKHTPGPWIAIKGDTFNPERPWGVSKYLSREAHIEIDGDDKEYPCRTEVIAELTETENPQEVEHTAYLIAAAPAMYAAMGDLISLFDMRLPNGLALNQVLPKEVWERVSTVVSMAKQVKAQAEGRER